MNSVKIIAIIAIVGGLAGFGILSNDVFLDVQSISVWETLTDFSDGHDCLCAEIDSNGELVQPINYVDCTDLSTHAEELCATPAP